MKIEEYTNLNHFNFFKKDLIDLSGIDDKLLKLSLSKLILRVASIFCSTRTFPLTSLQLFNWRIQKNYIPVEILIVVFFQFLCHLRNFPHV